MTRRSSSQAQEALARFLDRRVFNPILRTPPSRYRASDRKALELVQRKTESEKERVHAYPSAAYLRRQYERKIRPGSAAAARTNQALERLHLPRLADVRDEFLGLCDQLGVQPAPPAHPRRRSRRRPGR